ncbi:MAG TPA: glycosyltransferase family A protein [Acidobacteriaceae bacterium]|jgi:glycosyltransferase involved in cell wall biosynthesis|nr:glycosyltransferase family A protein [Acidobacteriaceae bacterium]
MSSNAIKYVIISPVRDEEANLARTIDSVVAQSIRPWEWVIVDDGSSDRTAEIADTYARQHNWIKVCRRQNRGFRKAGGGVVDAFNDGYRMLETKDWDFIVKLDGDLSFNPEYFQSCLRVFEEDKKLGIAGGTIYNVIKGQAILEACPVFHVRGATKIYRRECWDAIGGFWPAPGWDTMDEVKAQMLGWSTRTLAELQVLHHRPTGKNDGTWGAGFKNGRANYICGYHPLFMVLKCAKRLREKPYVIQSAALFCGFISGYLKGIPQVDDRPTIQYLRRQQMGRLLGGETIWR